MPRGYPASLPSAVSGYYPLYIVPQASAETFRRETIHKSESYCRVGSAKRVKAVVPLDLRPGQRTRLSARRTTRV